jgi:hypothetical protein
MQTHRRIRETSQPLWISPGYVGWFLRAPCPRAEGGIHRGPHSAVGVKYETGGNIMTPRKQTMEKKTPAKGNARKGESYTCQSCGLAVTVDEDCGCVDACEIMCCDMPMKKTRKSRAAAVSC